MSTAATFPCSCFSCWDGTPPEAKDLEKLDMAKGNWQRVTVNKLDAEGKPVVVAGETRKYTYIMDAKTGDLYLDESKSTVAMKSWGIFMGAVPYGAIVMVSNVISIAIEICTIVWRVLAEFGETWKNKGAFDALASVFFALAWEVPKSVCKNVWNAVRPIFFTPGVMLGAAWGVFSPYEGRRMVAEVEQEWHDGLTYKDDFRMGKNENFLSKMDDCKRYSDDCGTCFSEIKTGKVWFLGWCMQVRGNIHAKVAGVAKYSLASQ